MKFSIPSSGAGDGFEKFRASFSTPRPRIGYVPNALDSARVDPVRRSARVREDTDALAALGFDVEILNLRAYFGMAPILSRKLATFDGIWVGDGNVFILRRAMRLSGFDGLPRDRMGEEFVYGGSGAGWRVLSASLESYAPGDDPGDSPYPELPEPIMRGLGHRIG